MVYPSGEVETSSALIARGVQQLFRMVYPSGEVETYGSSLALLSVGGSGWFIHPGKLKRRPEVTCGRRGQGSGWFIHPGKLKRERHDCRSAKVVVPDGLSIRGS